MHLRYICIISFHEWPSSAARKMFKTELIILFTTQVTTTAVGVFGTHCHRPSFRVATALLVFPPTESHFFFRITTRNKSLLYSTRVLCVSIASISFSNNVRKRRDFIISKRKEYTNALTRRGHNARGVSLWQDDFHDPFYLSRAQGCLRFTAFQCYAKCGDNGSVLSCACVI